MENTTRQRKPATHHKKGTAAYNAWILRKRLGALAAWSDPQKRQNITKGRWHNGR